MIIYYDFRLSSHIFFCVNWFVGWAMIFYNYKHFFLFSSIIIPSKISQLVADVCAMVLLMNVVPRLKLENTDVIVNTILKG